LQIDRAGDNNRQAGIIYQVIGVLRKGMFSFQTKPEQADLRTGCSLSLCVCLILFTGILSARSSGKLEIFSGEPRLVIVNGYSTSFHWWRILQRKIDRYTGNNHSIEIVGATQSRSPIAYWYSLKKKRPRGPWKEKLRPALQSKGERPAIVLAQQSLQGSFDKGVNGIQDRGDRMQINHGADVLEMFVNALHKDGADLVFLATHIYKRSKEPKIGNERYALAELVKRDTPGFHEGPDVWDATRQHFPQAFVRDMVHPSAMGDEIMAQKWFETLLEHDGLEVPEWSREEMANAINNPVEHAEEHYNSGNRTNLGKPERKDHLSPGPYRKSW